MALPGKALAPYQGRAAGQAEGARGRQLQALAFRLRLEQCHEQCLRVVLMTIKVCTVSVWIAVVRPSAWGQVSVLVFLTRSMFISWLGPAVCMVLKFRRQRLISARAAHQNAWKESVLAVAAIKQSHVSICVNGAQRLSFFHCPNRTRARLYFLLYPYTCNYSYS